MKSSFSPGLGDYFFFPGRGSQEPSRPQRCEAVLFLLCAQRRSEMKRVSHQDSLQLKPLFRNCDCTHETCLQQLLPLVFKGGKRFSLGCLFFGCLLANTRAGAAGPCHLEAGVTLDYAQGLSNYGSSQRRGFPDWHPELFLVAVLFQGWV